MARRQGGLVVPDFANVLAIRCLHEGVDAGEGRLMPAAEQRNIAVDHRVCRFKSEFERSADLFGLLLL
jgi:hypothetical protein